MRLPNSLLVAALLCLPGCDNGTSVSTTNPGSNTGNQVSDLTATDTGEPDQEVDTNNTPETNGDSGFETTEQENTPDTNPDTNTESGGETTEQQPTPDSTEETGAPQIQEPNELIFGAANQVKSLRFQQGYEAPASHTDLESAAEALADIPLYSYSENQPITQTGETLHAAIRVTDLLPRTVYRFAVETTGEQAIFVFNLDENNLVLGPVCIDNSICTGTAASGNVLIVLFSISASESTHQFTITQTDDRPVYNEGTTDAPVELGGELPVLYSGAVGAIQATGQSNSQSLIPGQSFYRIANLTPGNRYSIAIRNLANNDAIIDFTTPVDIHCDPNFSNEHTCQFVALTNDAQFTVKGDRAIFGDSYDLLIEQLATADLFDGIWNDPLPIHAEQGNSVRHLAVVDHVAGSYYRLENLDPEIPYHVLATGKTDGAELSLFNPQSGRSAYSPQCSRLIDGAGSGGDAVCVIKGTETAHLWLSGKSLNPPISTYGQYGSALATHLVLTVVPGFRDEGTADNPKNLVVENQNSTPTRYPIQMRQSSVYEISGLTPGTPIMLSTSATDALTTIKLIDTTDTTKSCSDSGNGYCVFTPSQTSELVAISTNDDTIGQSLHLTVGPLPSNESMTLTADDLPYTGTVAGQYSQYTINSLQADAYYLADVSNASTRIQLAAWPAVENTINCMVNNGSDHYTGCLVADNTGSIKLRVNTRNSQPGAIYTINTISAIPLPGDYNSADTPITIADNNPTGSVSNIIVQDMPRNTADAISVSVLLDHGYSKDLLITLIAPDGSRVILADHAAGSLNTHTTFSDKATRSNDTTEASLYRRSVRPLQPLHPLRDVDPGGQWQLHVVDDRYSNISSALGGTLLGWSISFDDFQ